MKRRPWRWAEECIDRRRQRDRSREEARQAAVITALGSGRVVSGPQLAKAASVSLRTIYRDIEALRDQGHDIRSGAGFGFMLYQRRAAA